jgi:hypothetical protein
MTMNISRKMKKSVLEMEKMNHFDRLKKMALTPQFLM